MATRTLLVSNRLPFRLVAGKGGYVFERTVGGLATALESYTQRRRPRGGGPGESLWVGWPGEHPPVAAQGAVAERLLEERHAYPVFVDPAEMDRFYNGFCNGTLWPLFHGFSGYATYEPRHWESYRAIQERFRDAVLRVAAPGDTVWIHDYHLMLLPSLLREARPRMRIGFFLHIPFPAYAVFRLLPRRWAREILLGLYGADLVGFHTHEYVQSFLQCALRVLGDGHDLGRIVARERSLRAGAYPIGIDVARHAAAPRRRRRAALPGRGTVARILSVDRLDYTKGIPERLRAFERFLEKYPAWIGRVRLAMVVVPSRIGVVAYRDLKSEVDRAVGRINGRFGTSRWTPVLYLYRALDPDALAEAYRESDIALVTPLRDGMNLVAMEWVASRARNTGVLVLSEAAGASQELAEALQVNPNDMEDVADALHAALRMPLSRQASRLRAMRSRLRRNGVVRWVDHFLADLGSAWDDQERLRARLLGGPSRDTLVGAYRGADRRLLLLDYDGTLAPFALDPRAVRPGPGLLGLLGSLARDRRTSVALVSGRDRATLHRWFGGTPLTLVAEHGAWVCPPEGRWRPLRPLATGWKKGIRPILARQAERLPGSFLEEKTCSIAWHFRPCDPDLAEARVRDVADELIQLTANLDVGVLLGNKVLEVCAGGVNKGGAARMLLDRRPFDFVLAVGDDTTDEEMFRALPGKAYSIRVGMATSHARFNVRGIADVLDLLRDLAAPRARVAGSR
ncbi:MAG: bifunctional alpha,alpha-trehalose-phosphate synthase (UDP-forming)/trehalose-phosphatase [Planctomycetes bacterium]|nr:bifunctional alpha,alpha-trehalose-phosphate synthase (UDP-forming)/trehalose-phosphatase [Planctomycetota bacterium]